MKSITYTSLLTAVLCLSQPARSQTPERVAVISPPPSPGYVVGLQSPQISIVQVDQPGAPPALRPIVLAQAVPKTPPKPGPQLGTDEAAVELDQAKADVDRAQAQLDQLAGSVANVEPTPGGFRYWATSGSPFPEPRALVIRTSETDAKTLSETEKDLAVMGHILEKSLSSPEDGPHQAMGIHVYTLGNHSPVKNFQIEGYGAIFMLHVNFPLAGPASKSEESAEKEPSNSTWDEATRELYGPPPGMGRRGQGASYPKEDYDPSRVEKLKNTLLEALKNASHMHHLKSDEYVTIVVTSGGGEPENSLAMYQDRISALVRAGAAPSSGTFGISGGGGGNNKALQFAKNVYREGGVKSTLSIRARKSDIDAFANGKWGLKEFRNKVEMLVY